jgi:hypothetical protein
LVDEYIHEQNHPWFLAIPYYHSGSFFLNQEKCTKCLYIGENPLFQLVLFLSKMCVKRRIWLKKYKNFLGWRGGGIPPNPLAALVIFTWATAF